MQQSVSALRRSLLEGRLSPVYDKSKFVPQMEHFNPLKTNSMLAMEYRHGELLESLIAYPKPLRDCARRLGVSDATISKWRLALGLRRVGTHATNHSDGILTVLPPLVSYKKGKCKDCNAHWASRVHRRQCLQKDPVGTTGV